MTRNRLRSLALLALCFLPACAARSVATQPVGLWALPESELPGLELGSAEAPGVLPPSSIPTTRELDGQTLEEARQAEAERALQALWSVAGSTEALDAEWEFRFWSHRGALTFLSLQRTEEGEGVTLPVARGAFLPGLSDELPTLLGPRSREVTLSLSRQETRWSAEIDTSSASPSPAHVRTIPTVRGGLSAQTHQQVLAAARRIARLMSVPRGGSTQLTVRVSLEDARLVGWEPVVQDTSGGGPALSANEDAVNLIASILTPFTQGLGERTLALSLEGEHRHGEDHPRWRVLAARVLEPPPPPRQVADFHKEYRALHEYILVEFQEQSRDYAVLAAGFTFEQIAYAVVGGLALKGAWVLVGKGAPTIVSFLSRGGKGAVRWFRNLLVRAPAEERELLARLWMKAETQGLHSLSAAEKQHLQALMARLERILETPLDEKAKGRLWEWSREEYFTLYNPQLAKALGIEGMQAYQVHHIYPLRYAHLFPRLDINGKANLAGLHKDVHASINAVWLSLGRASKRMRPQDVKQVVDIVNRHYGRWFDKVYDSTDRLALENAGQAALREVAKLKAQLAL